MTSRLCAHTRQRGSNDWSQPPAYSKTPCWCLSTAHGATMTAPPAVALMSKLSADEQRAIFSKLCNVLNPRDAVAFSSASSELRAVTQPLQQ